MATPIYYLTDSEKNWAIKQLTFPVDGSLNIYGNTYTHSTVISNTQLGVGISKNITGTNNVALGYLVNPQLTTGTHNISIGSSIGTNSFVNSRNIGIGSSVFSNMNKKTGLTGLGLASSGSYFGFNTGTFGLNFTHVAGPPPAVYPSGYAFVFALTSSGMPTGQCFVTAVYLTSGGSGFTNSTGFSITVVGISPMSPANIFPIFNNANNGNDNIAIGHSALSTTTSATYNTAIGNYALTNLNQNITELNDNIAIGYKSQHRVIEGLRNISIGNYTLSGNAGSNNAYKPYDVICIGNDAMSAANYDVFGNTSICIGNNSMNATAGTNNLTYKNICIGHDSYRNSTGSNSNIVLGCSSATTLSTGYKNLILGHNAGNNLTTGSQNIIVGNELFCNLTTGSNNTVIGPYTGAGLTTGTFNVIIGYGCHATTTSQTNNCVYIGRDAGFAFAGGQSVFVGYNAGYSGSNSTSAAMNNVGIGTNAGYSLTSGANNTFIGTTSTTASATTSGSNVTTLGFNALPSTQTVNNQITLGNASITSLRCQVALTALSDARDKKDIEDLSVGLDFINKLRPVKFTWNMRPEIETDASGNTTEVYSTRNGDVEAGFIAQELDSVQEETNSQWLDIVYKDNPERLETTQGKLIPLLVKAIQELSAKVDSLTAEIAILKAK
jgi:hypothetical protein